jgi:hypothetical protein
MGFHPVAVVLQFIVDVFTVLLLRNGLHNTVVLLLLSADYIENTASSVVA